MIVPSIDIKDGRAVQLRQGKEFVLDGGDPMEKLGELSIVGEVAVVDLDAAMGTGHNRDLIRLMIRRAPCRVGGGIRTREQAVEWLNQGVAHIMVGTAASPEFFEGLPRERLIAAVDAERANVVVEGWTKATNVDPITRVAELAPHVGGFLFTQVEHEGGMAGFDWSLVERVSAAALECRVTAAGGITYADEVGRLDRMGVDSQVGMALYTGKLSLGDSAASCLKAPESDGTRGPIIWPTIVQDESGATLGLVWSSVESLVQAIAERQGIYWSRSRRQLWRKGETSGNRQTLLNVSLDCDRDAIQFTVRQHGSAFCHTGSRSCFGTAFDLGALANLIDDRRESSDLNSRTVRLFNDPDLLGSKLREEAAELAEAVTEDEVIHEAADVLYFTLTAMSRAGVRFTDVVRELERRSGAVVRRKLEGKEGHEKHEKRKKEGHEKHEKREKEGHEKHEKRKKEGHEKHEKRGHEKHEKHERYERKEN